MSNSVWKVVNYDEYHKGRQYKISLNILKNGRAFHGTRYIRASLIYNVILRVPKLMEKIKKPEIFKESF